MKKTSNDGNDVSVRAAGKAFDWRDPVNLQGA